MPPLNPGARVIEPKSAPLPGCGEPPTCVGAAVGVGVAPGGVGVAPGGGLAVPGTARPSLATATHTVVLGQLTPPIVAVWPATCSVAPQVLGPANGSADAYTVPPN